MRSKKIKINYVTSSKFKISENEIFFKKCKLSNGRKIKDLFSFQIDRREIPEMLEVDIAAMAEAEVVRAYGEIKVPCIVEHAGLVFEEYKDLSYPGGLTKPMWNTLGGKFIGETKSGGRKAIARAVVAYCDGKNVRMFFGETKGRLAEKPRGKRHFYWDTIFIPDGEFNKTYAQIVDEKGLEYKVEKLSQSSKAKLKLLEFLIKNKEKNLWS